MKNENLIGDKLNLLLEISEEEMDLCTTLDESFNVTIDYCMIGAIKITKFSMIMQGIEKCVIPHLINKGIPKKFAIKRVQLDLLEWCQNYVNDFKERMNTNNLESEEIFVEEKLFQEISQTIINWK